MAVTGNTNISLVGFVNEWNGDYTGVSMPAVKKVLVISFSFHHMNTEKIARAIANVFDAELKMPQQVNPEELEEYGLIGFGSGIDSQKHHRSLLDLVDGLPKVFDRNAFIFSTSGMAQQSTMINTKYDQHLTLRRKLRSKGYTVIGEYNCLGWNTNGFLKLFGGMNKGRPDDKDLRNAEEFARGLRRNRGGQ